MGDARAPAIADCDAGAEQRNQKGELEHLAWAQRSAGRYGGMDVLMRVPPAHNDMAGRCPPTGPCRSIQSDADRDLTARSIVAAGKTHASSGARRGPAQAKRERAHIRNQGSPLGCRSEVFRISKFFGPRRLAH
jgi:hypothetical protein